LTVGDRFPAFAGGRSEPAPAGYHPGENFAGLGAARVAGRGPGKDDRVLPVGGAGRSGGNRVAFGPHPSPQPLGRARSPSPTLPLGRRKRGISSVTRRDSS